jgi:DNA-binding NtrC family response regulator
VTTLTNPEELVVELSPSSRSNRAPFLLVGDASFVRGHGAALRARGFEIVEAMDDDAAAAARAPELAGAIVLLRRGSPSALAAFEAIHAARPTLPVVVASYQPTVAEAVRVMQLGATSCVAIAAGSSERLPALSADLLESLQTILQSRPASAPTERARRMGPLSAARGLVGESDLMKGVLQDVALVAPMKTTVLILGETGTGKERIAQAIHQGSPRRSASFVAVNCAAISETLLESELFGHEKGAFTGAHCRREGLFKIADGGTLFLDEIGETSPALQAKLLRVLQERQFERVGGTSPVATDVRVIAATNRNLRQMVNERLFRSDLFYRLNVMTIHVPALRQRREDLAPLIAHILARLSFELGISRPALGPEVLTRFAEYGWPGNVRELENVLERLMVVSQDRTVGLGDLPPEIRLGASAAAPQPGEAREGGWVADGRPPIPGASFREIERHAILATYEACGQSPSRTAQVLGLSLRTVHYRLREYRGEDGRRTPRLESWASRTPAPAPLVPERAHGAG